MSRYYLNCLNCCHVKFHQPSDWTPRFKSDSYDASDVRKRIKQTGLVEPVTCTLSPEWHEFNTNHYCGQWAPRLGPFHQALDSAVSSSGYYRERAEKAEEANARLKLELKKTRDRSAARLDKLRTIKQPGKAARQKAGAEPAAPDHPAKG
jgi:hypothetical protein